MNERRGETTAPQGPTTGDKGWRSQVDPRHPPALPGQEENLPARAATDHQGTGDRWRVMSQQQTFLFVEPGSRFPLLSPDFGAVAVLAPQGGQPIVVRYAHIRSQSFLKRDRKSVV